MLCEWCGGETPDNSAFCEKCGHTLGSVEATPDFENAEVAHDSASVVADGKGIEQDEAEPSAIEGMSSDEAVIDMPESYSQASAFDDVEISVEAIRRTRADDLLVEPPSPPIQPKLSGGRVVVVGVIAVLFAAAVILLAWASIIRFLGL